MSALRARLSRAEPTPPHNEGVWCALSGVGVSKWSGVRQRTDISDIFLLIIIIFSLLSSFVAVSSTSVSKSGVISESVCVGGVESVEWEQVGPKNKSAITRQVSCV